MSSHVNRSTAALAISPRRRRLPWAAIRAGLVFVAIFGAWLWMLTIGNLQEHIWLPFVNIVAQSAGLIFRVFGARVAVSGLSLSVNGVSLTIAFGCDGLEAHGIFIAAIFAAALSWKRRLLGLLVGTIGIFLINQIRVCGIFLAARFGSQWFYYAHTVVGQTFVIVATMGLFLWWVTRDESPK
jgi:exosortase/archaeosortase family protein